MTSGETKIKDTTWSVSPSVSPRGTSVSVHLEGQHGSAWVPLDADQAQELGDALLEASNWCRKHV